MTENRVEQNQKTPNQAALPWKTEEAERPSEKARRSPNLNASKSIQTKHKRSAGGSLTSTNGLRSNFKSTQARQQAGGSKSPRNNKFRE